MKFKLLLISLLIFSPLFSFGQQVYTGAGNFGSTGYSSGTTTTSYGYQYNDGSNEASSTIREHIRGYRHQSSDIEQKINALGTTPVASVYMPVLFGVGIKNISPNFGDPRPGGRTHEGEDVMAVKGTPIVSPTAAVVLKTEVGSSEGNAVYTANPGGETFVYMHLDRFGEGVVSGKVLTAGSLIGYVGNTGNAAGGPAHLHFEIHNSQSIRIDPFPRLTSEFTIGQKISYLSTILGQSVDPVSLSTLLVTNFRSSFIEAEGQGITPPPQILSALATVPLNITSPSKSYSLPNGDLTTGSSGSAVVDLQNYLIKASAGPAAAALMAAGPTGTFGSITKAALIEFQTAVSITPASGYYGSISRSYITTHPTNGPITPVILPSPNNSATTSANGGGSNPNLGTPFLISRDLYQGLSGEDVRTLQKILNDNGFVISTSGAGSPGNETTYFGSATLAAVIRFQIAKNITPSAGYVGPITRGALVSI